MLTHELAPLFHVLGPLNEQIAAADRRIEALASEDPAVALLRTAPGIGRITAAAIVATADDITRFQNAHQFEAFLGLVPGELSSGERRRVGRITKQGNVPTRYPLVEAGWRILRSKSEDTTALRAWALSIAARRGNASRSSRSRDVWPASFTRCGATAVRSMRANCECHGPARRDRTHVRSR